MAGVSYNVNPEIVNGYISDLEKIISNLGLAEEELGTNFVNDGASIMPEAGDFVKKEYNIEGKVSAMETLVSSITEFKNWMSETLAEIQASDAERAEKYGDSGIGANGSDPGSNAGNGSKTPSVSKVTSPSMSKITTPKKNPSTIAPVTTPGGGGNPSTTPGIDTPSNPDPSSPTTAAPVNPVTTPSITPKTSPSILPTAAPTVSPSSYSAGGGIVSPTVSATVSPTASAMGADGKNGVKSGLGSSLKGILEAGTQLKGNLNDGLSNLTGRIGESGGLLSAGTAAGLALAAGGAAVTTGILLKNKSKSYKFKPEDFEALPEETQETILSQFKEVKASEEEIDLFKTSTFMIAASVYDEHIKKAESAYEKDQNTSQLVSENYGFEIYNENGTVNKYLLFVAMLIDGCSETNEKNIYNIFNLALDEEDIDFIYSGLNMFDYLAKEEQEEDTSKYEEYEMDEEGFEDNQEESDSSEGSTSVESWLQDMGALD